MEADGLIECFQVSEKDRKLRCINYLGDGDSKLFLEKSKLDIYPQKQVKKLECVGHMQKRLGGRLRKLKSTKKGTLSDGKTLSGKGCLTDKMINKLQNYFGITIRQCEGKRVLEMKKAIGADLFNCSEASNLGTKHIKSVHKNLIVGANIKLISTTIRQHMKINQGRVRELIKPIFVDLNNYEIPKKCLHGKTQNNNELINNLIWKRCPKDVYVGRTALEIGAASAVVNFNEGFQGMLKVFKELGINPGEYCVNFCEKEDSNRIQLMERKATPACKQRRKELRG